LAQQTPLITIGIVALNRAWIIDKVLLSIQNQTYPHSSLFILFVDGESKDGTAELVKQRLSTTDFQGYEVVVRKCSIPEGRNICLEKMRGELLLFWDSDVIMEPTAVSKLVETLKSENADVVTAGVNRVTVSCIDEIPDKLKNAKVELDEPCVEINMAGMGQTLLSEKVAHSVSFDPDLTIHEDSDFCLRVKEKGFKILLSKEVTVLDVNMNRVAHSDIYVDMPLKDALRAIGKKSRAQVYSHDFVSRPHGGIRFFSENKRYLFYLGYIPTIALSVYGLLTQNIYLILVFPVYALIFAGLQIRRRGAAKGFKAFLRSIVVGVPNALWVTYYCLKYSSKKDNRTKKECSS